jgi:hypothetical protein
MLSGCSRGWPPAAKCDSSVQDDSARGLAKLQGRLQQMEDSHRRQCSGMTGAEQERCRAPPGPSSRLPTSPRDRTCSPASRCSLRRFPSSAAAWQTSTSMTPFDARPTGNASSSIATRRRPGALAAMSTAGQVASWRWRGHDHDTGGAVGCTDMTGGDRVSAGWAQFYIQTHRLITLGPPET